MAKVLLYSPHPIGKSMAGPAIRTWEFAKALAEAHEVILLSSGNPELQGESFICLSIEDVSCKRHFQDANVLITQRMTVSLARLASSSSIKVIIDAYDPSPLELLEYYKRESVERRHAKIASETSTIAFSFKWADGILCATERQRDLWTGFLLRQKGITPGLYDRDPTLREMIDVVPFGLSSTPPEKRGRGLREKLGFGHDDKVILWGGGIWNWFDPLSLIKAMKIVSQTRPDIKLVFMGVKPPDPALPAMDMTREAMQLARTLDLDNQSVFFHQEWVPYDERVNFLLDADIGISTHFDHLETHFSFRTRMLDYLWAELPIISTAGDTFAELIERHRLGIVVPCQNERILAAAIFELLSDEKLRMQMKEQIHSVREQFYWQGVIKPLHKMIERLALLPRSQRGWEANKNLISFLFSKLREKGLTACLQKAFRQST